LLARTVVEGFMDGLHRSPFLGYSTEFSAYRSYSPGDDLRHRDWRVWARSDKYYVKQFEDDTNLRCQIFLDTSASMDFGKGEANKFDYGRILAAVLAYLMTSQHDAPGLVLFGEKARQAVPIQATRHHADEIFQALTRLRGQGKTIIGKDLFEILESLTRRGLAVVISDFFISHDTGLKVLEQLHGQGQEVILFHLLSPEELDLPFEGEWVLQDSETNEELPVHMESWRKDYQKRLEEFCERLKAQCVKLEIDYVRLRTSDPLDVALIAYLDKRGAV
jgi:uncharacterized protein (DUF58 family)